MCLLPFLSPSTPKHNGHSYPAKPTAGHRHPHPPPPNSNSNNQQQLCPQAGSSGSHMQARHSCAATHNTLCTPWLHSQSALDIHRDRLLRAAKHSTANSITTADLPIKTCNQQQQQQLSAQEQHTNQPPHGWCGAAQTQPTHPTCVWWWAPHHLTPPTTRCLQSMQAVPAGSRPFPAEACDPTSNKPRKRKNKKKRGCIAYEPPLPTSQPRSVVCSSSHALQPQQPRSPDSCLHGCSCPVPPPLPPSLPPSLPTDTPPRRRQCYPQPLLPPNRHPPPCRPLINAP
jgi:hypothetical protein